MLLDQFSFTDMRLCLAANNFQRTKHKRFGTVFTQTNAQTPILVLSKSPLKMLLHPAGKCTLDISVVHQCGDSDIKLLSYYILDVVNYMIAIKPALPCLHHVCIVQVLGILVNLIQHFF